MGDSAMTPALRRPRRKQLYPPVEGQRVQGSFASVANHRCIYCGPTALLPSFLFPPSWDTTTMYKTVLVPNEGPGGRYGVGTVGPNSGNGRVLGFPPKSCLEILAEEALPDSLSCSGLKQSTPGPVETKPVSEAWDHCRRQPGSQNPSPERLASSLLCFNSVYLEGTRVNMHTGSM